MQQNRWVEFSIAAKPAISSGGILYKIRMYQWKGRDCLGYSGLISLNILVFILQRFWFKTAGFVLTPFFPALRMQGGAGGSLGRHRGEKLLCHSGKTTLAFGAIPRARRSGSGAAAFRGGLGLAEPRIWGRDGFGVRVITVLCPAGARRRGAKSSSSLWRHSGIYLQRPRR